MKLKALAFALIAATGSANAAIISGSAASGELFLNAYSLSANVTFAFDTGITINDFLASSNRNWTFDFVNDAALGASDEWAMISGNNDIVWNLYASNVGIGGTAATVGLPAGVTVANATTLGHVPANAPSAAKWGVLSTSTNGGQGVINAGTTGTFLTGIAGAITNNMGTQLTRINTANTDGDSAAALVGGDTSSFKYTNFGGNFGGATGWSNEYGIDQNATLIFEGKNAVSGLSVQMRVAEFDGTVANLSSTGKLTIATVSAVPVPGAVWLLGSAIAAMATFSPRGKRKA